MMQKVLTFQQPSLSVQRKLFSDQQNHSFHIYFYRHVKCEKLCDRKIFLRKTNVIAPMIAVFLIVSTILNTLIFWQNIAKLSENALPVIQHTSA